MIHTAKQLKDKKLRRKVYQEVNNGKEDNA